MTGDFRDPMVGRDVLVGGILGLGHTIGIHTGVYLIQTYYGRFDAVTDAFSMAGLNGAGEVIPDFLLTFVGSTVQSLIMLFLAFLFYRLTGKKLFGVLAVGFLFFFIQFLFFALTGHLVLTVSAFINAVCMVIAMKRFGLLGLISFWFFFDVSYIYAVTFDSSLFYFPTSVLTAVITLGIIFYAFYISIAGQPIFQTKLLNEVEN
jgi:hypothetical protein